MECMNKIPIVPTYCVAKLEKREWVSNNQWGKNTLFVLTLARVWTVFELTLEGPKKALNKL